MSDIKLNMDSLLAPVSTGNPVGRNMEYDPAYDAIKQARESDPDYLPQDEWSATLRQAEWPQVISLSEAFLTHASKDLQISCWLTEALVHQYGIDGLAFGVRFLHQFISLYWEQCWPELDDDGELVRLAKLNGLDRLLAKQLSQEPLFGKAESTLDFWQKVLAFEHNVSLNPNSRQTLLENGDFSMESFNRRAASVPPTVLTTMRNKLSECQGELQQFERRFMEINPDSDNDIFSQTRGKIDEMDDFLRRISDRVEPDYSDVMSLNVLTTHANSSQTVMQNEVPKQGMSRDLAISQILTIAHFFRQTEPSSPVPFLMERAARWAGMTLTEWLEEMLQDDNSLLDINKVLKGRNS